MPRKYVKKQKNYRHDGRGREIPSMYREGAHTTPHGIGHDVTSRIPWLQKLTSLPVVSGVGLPMQHQLLI